MNKFLRGDIVNVRGVVTYCDGEADKVAVEIDGLLSAFDKGLVTLVERARAPLKAGDKARLMRAGEVQIVAIHGKYAWVEGGILSGLCTVRLRDLSHLDDASEIAASERASTHGA